MEIEKAYFTLPEILDRWSISEADLLYLAENDKLRLSVRVFNLPVEFGDYEETMEGERFTVPWEQSRYNGVLDLSLLIAAWKANPATLGLYWDLIIATMALSIWVIAEVYVRKNWTALIAIPVSFAIGPSCGLPLYLFLRTGPVR